MEMQESKTLNDSKEYGLVSIIMPNYNSAVFLEDTLKSVLAQTYNNWELLIVDDCSKDGSLRVIERFMKDEPRIKLFRLQKNYGAAHARNVALRNVSGEWVAFLDSDDLWYPQKLEKQLAFMAENGYAFSYTKYDRIDEANNALNEICFGPKVVTKRKIWNYCYIGCLTAMYKVDKVGLIQVDERIGNGRNDYALWLKVVNRSNCYLLNEVLATYRKRKRSLSHRSFLDLLRYQYETFKLGENKNKAAACIYTARNLFYGTLKKLFYKKRID